MAAFRKRIAFRVALRLSTMQYLQEAMPPNLVEGCVSDCQYIFRARLVSIAIGI